MNIRAHAVHHPPRPNRRLTGQARTARQNEVEIVPAILRRTYEGIEQDWQKIMHLPDHIQIDVTDGIFAGDGTFRDLTRLKRLPESQKIELHMMVHTPANFVDDIVDLCPARCIFHVESFAGTGDLEFVYQKLRELTQTELAVALAPESPNDRLEEVLPLAHYVQFMGYNPGWPNQPINPIVFNKIRAFADKHPDIRIAVDGHVAKDTIEQYVTAGARILCANTAIFGAGNPAENYQQLALLAQAAAAR